MKAFFLLFFGATMLFIAGYSAGAAPEQTQRVHLMAAVGGALTGLFLGLLPLLWRWVKRWRYAREARTLKAWVAMFPDRCPVCAFHRHAYENGCDLGKPLPHRCPDETPSLAELMAQGVRDMQEHDRSAS